MFDFQQIIRNESCTAGYVELEVDNPEKTVSMNMPMYGIMSGLIAINGLVMYAIYSDCDPLLSGQIERRDQVRIKF